MYKPDILCIQEHWLFNFEQNEIVEIHPQYEVMVKSIDDIDPISPKQRPRGYGGISIMWKKEIPVETMPDGSLRTQVVQIGNQLTLINTYMPCRGKYTTEDFRDEVDQVSEICQKYKHTNIILAGDMNVDIHRQHDSRSKYFLQLLSAHKLIEVCSMTMPTYTHHGNTSATKIDYILLSENTPHTQQATYEILPKVSYNTSPHQALLLRLPGQDIRRVHILQQEPKRLLQWNKADVEKYQEVLQQFLDPPGTITSPTDAVEYLTKAIQTATKAAVPTKIFKPNYKPPPWNDTIKQLLDDSKKADAMWKAADRPRVGPLNDEKRRCRSDLRRAQRIQNAVNRENKQNLLMKSTAADTQTFHKLIRQQRKTPQTVPTELNVNGVTHTGDLLPAWTDHFNALAQPLQDPAFNEEYNTMVQEELQAIHHICNVIHTQDIPITVVEIQLAIAQLKKKKAKDESGLVTEHLQLGGHYLEVYMASIINAIICRRDIPYLLKSGILHPIHKKNKLLNIAGNYRGITIIKIIGKVLDIILAKHQQVAIPSTHNMQFSFTQGRAPSHATLLMSEAIAQAKDRKAPLFLATMDIQKAFDVVPHNHLLRKLYHEGLTGKWWVLKSSAYADMHTKVTWNGKTGEIVKLHQGNRQGGIASTQDFKTVMKDGTVIIHNAEQGTHIGDIHIGIITCADDVIMLADSAEALLYQIELFIQTTNRERMIVHPTKTSVSVMGITESELQHLQDVQPFNINGVPIPIKSDFTHLGVDYDMEHPAATVSRTVEARLKIGRSTTYAIMGAGLHGWNGVNPITSWHIYRIYVQPKILYSLEAMNISGSKPNIRKLEVAMRAFMKNIITLPTRAANACLHIMLGCLPSEAIIDQRQIILINSICNNPLLLEIIINQLALRELKSSSWVIATQKLLRKYELPPMLEVIASEYTAEKWKTTVKKAVNRYWKKKIEADAETKSSLAYLNLTFNPGKPHIVWRAAMSDSRDVRRAIIKSRMMTGTYTLQANRAAFNQTSDKTCPLCGCGDENITHFTISCPATEHKRAPFIQEIMDIIPRVYQNHPSTDWTPEMMTHLVLDPTHKNISDILPLAKKLLHGVEKVSRILCFTLHKFRATMLEYRI